MIPPVTAADYTTTLGSLLPRGRAWPREPGSVVMQVMSWLAPTYSRLRARAVNLLIDGFPTSTVELLPEWEASLGLPDPCAGESPTIQQRRGQVVARFINNGGQSIAFFEAFAAALGYTITVTMFSPFRVGVSAVGQPLCSSDWAHTWRVNAPLVSETFFAVGQSAVGEPLASWGNSVLQCEILSVAPAHTIVQFAYT